MTVNESEDRPDRRNATDVKEAYLVHAHAVSHHASGDNTAWARDALDELVQDDPDAAWSLIIDIVNRADDDETLAYIAAGPLEDLIVSHSADVIDLIERSAAGNSRLRRALSGVWVEGDVPKDICERLQTLVSGESPL